MRELARAGGVERVDAKAVVHLGRQVFGAAASVLEDARSIGCPVTMLRGSLDEPYADPADRMLEAFPGARPMVIDGAYHSAQLTHPRHGRQRSEPISPGSTVGQAIPNPCGDGRRSA